ncbi:MAG: Rid family hydrolase, partial [Planctomycetota bacterium]
MSDKKIINTNLAPKAIGPYSQAVLKDGWLFVSGQIPINPETNELVAGDIARQTEQVLNNLKGVIEAAGGQLSDVIKTTVYL